MSNQFYYAQGASKNRLVERLQGYNFDANQLSELMLNDAILLEHALNRLATKEKRERVISPFGYLNHVCVKERLSPSADLLKLQARHTSKPPQTQLNSFNNGQASSRQYEPKRLDWIERRELRLRRLTYSLSVVEQGSNAERILKEDYERITRELEYDQNQTETEDNGRQAPTMPRQASSFN